ncbi:MAG TPA: hypothetical protein VJN39_14820 [Gemmatimonadales bacterium]|nr:hypothetical protein [Gemmatimonadales bacterium]
MKTEKAPERDERGGATPRPGRRVKFALGDRPIGYVTQVHGSNVQVQLNDGSLTWLQGDQLLEVED